MAKKNSLLKLTFPALTAYTAFLPLGAFIFCVCHAVVADFEAANNTHCHVFNFAPSISATIGTSGGHHSDRAGLRAHVWRICLALHSFPRLLLPLMYRRQYLLQGLNRICAEVACCVNVVEILSLLVMSFVTTRENYSVHKMGFILFVSCSSLYMLQKSVVSREVKPDRMSKYCSLGSLWRKRIFTVYLSSLFLALYFYHRHNKYCEPGVYSLFALSEYLLVLGNIAYHATCYFDFGHRNLVAYSEQ